MTFFLIIHNDISIVKTLPVSKTIKIAQNKRNNRRKSFFQAWGAIICESLFSNTANGPEHYTTLLPSLTRYFLVVYGVINFVRQGQTSRDTNFMRHKLKEVKKRTPHKIKNYKTVFQGHKWAFNPFLLENLKKWPLSIVRVTFFTRRLFLFSMFLVTLLFREFGSSKSSRRALCFVLSDFKYTFGLLCKKGYCYLEFSLEKSVLVYTWMKIYLLLLST